MYWSTRSSESLSCIGPIPTLMEWDNNIPDVATLIAESARTRTAEAEVLSEREIP